MKRRLSRISIHRTSLTILLTMSLMYAAVIFAIGGAMAIRGTPLSIIGLNFFNLGSEGAVLWLAISLGTSIALGLIYGIFAYLFTVVMTLVYNLVAKITGGVELTFSE